MKLTFKIIYTVLIGFVIAFSFLYIFFASTGKAIAIRKIQDLTQRKVTIEYVDLKPLFSLEIGKLEIMGLAKIDKINISPSFFGILRGKLIFNELTIIKPEITYEKRVAEAGQPIASAIVPAPKPTPAPEAKVEKKKSAPIIFKNLGVEDGSVTFIDYTIGEKPIKIIVHKINFHLYNTASGGSTTFTNLDLNAKLPWAEGKKEGSIEADGWFNLPKMDMHALLEIKDIDGIYLHPYYSKWVDLQKSRIEKATLNFSAALYGLNNDVSGECTLELVDVVFRPRAADEPQEKAEKIAVAVLGRLSQMDQGRYVLTFPVKTKMDKPEFNVDMIRNAFEHKIMSTQSGPEVRDVLMLPSELIEGIFRSAVNITKTVLTSTVAVGKEVAGTVTGKTKKEKK